MPKIKTRKRIRQPKNLEFFKLQDPKLFSAQIVLKRVGAITETLGAHEEFPKKKIDITSKRELDTVNAGAVEVIARLDTKYGLPVNANQSSPMAKLSVTNEIPKGIVSQRISRKCSKTIGDLCTQILIQFACTFSWTVQFSKHNVKEFEAHDISRSSHQTFFV